MESALAAWLPPLAALALTLWPRFDPDLARALRRWFVPLVLLWFAPCWLTGSTPLPFDFLAQLVPWRALGVAPQSNLLINDAVMQLIPWREAVRRAVAHGALPFLDPSTAAGSALWANPQPAVLYPLTWLGLWLSPFAWPLFEAEAKVLIAASGMYLFARREGASHLGAVTAAVAYAFGAFTIVFIFLPPANVTVLLPWALVVVQRCRAPFGWRHAAGAAFVVFAMLAGGHGESALHAGIVALAYAAATLRSRDAWRRLAASGLAGVTLALPVLLPFASILRTTERVALIAVRPSLLDAPAPTLRNIVLFVAPALANDRRVPFWGENYAEVATQYVGVATLLLAVLAGVKDRRRFWIATFVIATLLAFKIPLIAPLVSRIPLLDMTLNGRLRFVVAFATAILAARGVDLLPLARGRVLIPLVVFADLALVLGTFYPPVSRQWLYPKTGAIAFLQAHARGQRIAGIDYAMPPNSALMYGLDDVGGHDPAGFEPYLRMLEQGGYDRRAYFATFRGMPSRRMLDFLGVRYVIAPPSASAPLPAVYRGADAVVFENPTARPVSPPTLSVDLPRPSTIVLNRAAIPGWELTRDGVPWPIEPAMNGAFLAWRAPAGRSTFAARYVPPHLRLACLLALLVIPLVVLARDRIRSAP
jgi:hypothetical protein